MIAFLKERAKEFLHNQGLELNKATEKEIENNVDLQVKESDSPQVKAQKEADKANLKELISNKQNELKELQDKLNQLES